jgi:hypothetical protein
MGSRKKLLLITLSALLSIGSAFFVSGKIKQIKELKADVSAYRNNARQYESIAAGLAKDNRTLRLNNSDLRQSNDSLVVSIEKIRKSLKTPENKPGDISSIVVVSVTDTAYVKIDNEVDFELDTVVNYNEMTSSSIKIDGDTLTSSINVNNSMYLYVYSRREYVNKYKNGWIRFWRFDWRKESVDRYDILNTNDLVKVLDTRVIKIRE